MPYKKSFRGRRKPYRKARKSGYKKRTYKGKRLVKAVKQVMARQVETKVLQYSGNLTVRSISGTITQAQFDTGCLMITPQGAVISGITQPYPVISNGTGQDQRIGDEIKIKGQYIDYLIQAEDYNVSTNPTPRAQIVTLWVIRPKMRNALGQNVYELQSGSSSAIFFENQYNGDSGFSGTMVDMLRKVDTDNFTVIAKRIYKVGWQGTLNTSNQVSTHQQNDFKQFYKGRVKIPAYKWKCDRTDLYQGRQTYMFLTTHAADNTSQAPTILPVNFDFNLTTYYTDM